MYRLLTIAIVSDGGYIFGIGKTTTRACPIITFFAI